MFVQKVRACAFQTLINVLLNILVIFRRWKASLRPTTVVLGVVVLVVLVVVTLFEKCLRLC